MQYELKRTTAIYLIVFLNACSGGLSADTELRIERYILKNFSPTTEQLDLLSAIIETQYPARVNTIGDAIDYSLLRSGFNRIDVPESREVMNLPLPYTHRYIGPLDLRTTIQTLAGESLILQEDPLKRKIWFKMAGSEFTPTDPTSAPKDTLLDKDDSNTTNHTWLLVPTHTLRSNFETWAERIGWTVEWNSRHDYEVSHAATFEGTLKEAVAAALEHYRAAPIPLSAKFYSGNSVMLIESVIGDQ